MNGKKLKYRKIMKIIFFGTPDYVLPILEKLHKYYEVVAVITQSPKPVGKKKILTYSAIDDWAHKRKIPKFYEFTNLPKADLGVLASYGNLIPKEVINIFPLGILVIHPSLLPQFRWSNPIRATLITGTNPTGVTIFKMDEKWDSGPILTQFKEEVFEDDDNESLRNRLFKKAADVLIEMLPSYREGKIKPKPQDETKATYAKLISKNDGFIPFEFIKNAMEINNNEEILDIPFIKGYSTVPDAKFLNRFIKAMKPWPAAWTKIKINEKEFRLKLIDAHLDFKTEYLVLDKVQLESKGPVSWNQFKSAYQI